MIEYNTESNLGQIVNDTNDDNESYYNHISGSSSSSSSSFGSINNYINNNIIITNSNSSSSSTTSLIDGDGSFFDNINNFDFSLLNVFSTISTTTSASAPLLSSSSSLSSTATLGSISFKNSTDYNNIFNGSFEDYITCPDVYEPEDKFTEFEFWVCGVVLNLVGILGIFGNILSMVILSRPQMRSSINYLLIGLARCDTVLIITSILLFGIPAIYPYTGYLFYYYYYIYPNISPCVYPIAMASQTASVYLTFTVTLERYVAVCHPLRARALCTYGRAKIYFIVCIVFSVLYNLPRFWEVIIIAYAPNYAGYGSGGGDGGHLNDPNDNVDDVIFCVAASKLRRNSNYIRIYIHWCYLVFIYFIPFSTLAILNCLIYRQVQKANRERQRLSRTEKREIGLATMLLCVVIVFFLFNFLALYTNILEAFYGIINEYLVKISNLLVTINSSANFIIYVIFGEKFKRIFLLLFCKGHMSRDTPDLIHYESSISNGDGTNRSSGRFSRHGTTRSTTRNGITATTTTQMTNTTQSCRIKRSTITNKRNRAPSPGPCVYYPARELQRTTILTHSTSLNCDWDTKNGLMTSGF